MELIVDVLSSTASTMRIGGEVLPVDAVRQRFRQLDSEHIKYVIDSLRQTTTKINNIRAYLLTALYNAPITIGPLMSVSYSALNTVSAACAALFTDGPILNVTPGIVLQKGPVKHSLRKRGCGNAGQQLIRL